MGAIPPWSPLFSSSLESVVRNTVKALGQAAGREGGALAAWVVGCMQPPPPLLTFMVHLSQPRHLSQGSPEKQNPWDMHVCSTYTCMYVHMCYEYIPLALFLRKALTHAQTHTHTCKAFITRNWLMRFRRLSLTIHRGSQESWWFHF